MISPAALVLLSLASWLVPIAWLAIASRRDRRVYRTRHGIRYRRVDTDRMLRDLRRREGRASLPRRPPP